MERKHIYWLGLCVVIAVLVCGIANIQASRATQTSAPAPTDNKTQLEAFEAQTGTVIVKGYTRINTVQSIGRVSVDCMEITNANTGRKQTGIMFEVVELGRLDRSSRSYVDYDEIEPLLNGIDYLSKLTVSCTQLSNFEAVYVTQGTLKIVVYNDESGAIEVAVKSGHIGSVTAFIKIKDLAEIRTCVAKAKKQLDDIR